MQFGYTSGKQPEVSPLVDFSILFHGLPEPYIALNTSMRIVGANKLYQGLTGITESDYGTVFPEGCATICALFFLEDIQAISRAVREVHRTNTVQPAIQLKAADTGSVVCWEAEHFPVCGSDGSVQYVIQRLKTGKRHPSAYQHDVQRSGQIFESGPLMRMITRLSDGKIMAANKLCERITGLRAEEMIGRTTTELGLLTPRERADMIAFITKQCSLTGEFGLEHKDVHGNVRLLHCYVEMTHFEGEDCILSAAFDNTERRETEQKLEEANRFLDTVLENIPHMVVVMESGELRVAGANAATQKILGLNPAALLGKNYFDLYPHEEAQRLSDSDMIILKNGITQVINAEAINLPLGTIWLHTKKIPIYEGSKPKYLLWISEDITDRKRQNDDIEALNNELESFAYSVSHDLRAPLRAITGYSEMLRSDVKEALQEEGIHLLNRISYNAHKMNILINDLLAFAKLGKNEVRKQPTDMNELLEEALQQIQRLTPQKTIIKKSRLPDANADPNLMLQVFVNLLSNAVKYSSKNERPVVEITASSQKKELIYCITDNGTGFDMKYAHKLFKVFQRLHRYEEYEGTGVGLAIVQRIVLKHGGRVWAEASSGKGASFFIALPC